MINISSQMINVRFSLSSDTYKMINTPTYIFAEYLHVTFSFHNGNYRSTIPETITFIILRVFLHTLL